MVYQRGKLVMIDIVREDGEISRSPVIKFFNKKRKKKFLSAFLFEFPKFLLEISFRLPCFFHVSAQGNPGALSHKTWIFIFTFNMIF